MEVGGEAAVLARCFATGRGATSDDCEGEGEGIDEGTLSGSLGLFSHPFTSNPTASNPPRGRSALSPALSNASTTPRLWSRRVVVPPPAKPPRCEVDTGPTPQPLLGRSRRCRIPNPPKRVGRSGGGTPRLQNAVVHPRRGTRRGWSGGSGGGRPWRRLRLLSFSRLGVVGIGRWRSGLGRLGRPRRGGGGSGGRRGGRRGRRGERGGGGGGGGRGLGTKGGRGRGGKEEEGWWREGGRGGTRGRGRGSRGGRGRGLGLGHVALALSEAPWPVLGRAGRGRGRGRSGGRGRSSRSRQVLRHGTRGDLRRLRGRGRGH